LLARWSGGDGDAVRDLVPVVYRELHRLAAGAMRGERRDHTLQPTALVNEAYLRLARQPAPAWRDRAHFFAVAARMMRRILVDHARRSRAGRRGGDRLRVTLDGRKEPGVPPPATDLLALDQALAALAAVDARKAKVVELRFFAGLSAAETAAALAVSVPTVLLDSRLARAWLYDRLHGEAGR
jgi:RNA polymerase sigma factor (TIGR02999 family)